MIIAWNHHAEIVPDLGWKVLILPYPVFARHKIRHQITHETTTRENARNDYSMGFSPTRRVRDGLASTEVALSRVRDAIGMISDHVMALMNDNPLPSNEKALKDDLEDGEIDSEEDSKKQLGMLLEVWSFLLLTVSVCNKQ
jgi:hypothetical protein